MKQTRTYKIITKVEAIVEIPIQATSEEDARQKYLDLNFYHADVRVAAVSKLLEKRGVKFEKVS